MVEGKIVTRLQRKIERVAASRDTLSALHLWLFFLLAGQGVADADPVAEQPLATWRRLGLKCSEYFERCAGGRLTGPGRGG